MRVGIPSEVKDHEYRVAITPAGVHELTRLGNEVFIERGAGVGSSISDEEFKGAGAQILEGADQVWEAAELLLKVKEPLESEYHRLRDDLTLFTFLHLAATRACTDAILKAGTTAIAYETVQSPNGRLPLLYPMSEVAGCLAPQAGAHALLSTQGGRGLLPGGVTGVKPANIVVIGAGVSGSNAIAMATGLWANVTAIDKDIDKLREVDRRFSGRVKTVVANAYEIEAAVVEADMVIGAILVPGARAPKVISNELVAKMKPASVLVDIAIDQGGCFEDSRPTTHADPVFKVHDSLFYCVANMPGAVPNTSTFALTNATLPYVTAIVEKGWKAALRDDAALAHGLNTFDGHVTNLPVAEAHEVVAVPVADVLA
ncbi:MAG: alanine dehydrogenase [Nitriliruptor sp.]|nr:MAG: alanine dehydrogenase [Nitriliruptor sp.]